MRQFEFGKNWQAFIKDYLREENVEEARGSLESFCEGFDFSGKAFADAGCGSGLFSLAAHRMGAARVVSFDISPDSTRGCEYLREREGAPDNWEIMTGSILDPDFLRGLGTFDFVYSWGVLHHTGAMWRAIDNVAGLVAPGGMLYIAIYNRAEKFFALHPDGRFGSSKFWEFEKRIYSRLPRAAQTAIDYVCMALMALIYLLTFRNPARMIREYARAHRGMSWRIDIRDWLGGYPYEYAAAAEIEDYVAARGFELVNIRANTGLLNNEFLFRKLE